MFKKLRSTQRPSHSGAPGRLASDPSVNNQSVNFGPRKGHDTYRLSNITNDRVRTTAHSLSRRFTKFIQNFTGQIKVPHDLLDQERDRDTPLDNYAQRRLDVGQIPED